MKRKIRKLSEVYRWNIEKKKIKIKIHDNNQLVSKFFGIEGWQL